MGRVGCALDNAAAEAFNSTIKVEYIHRQRFRTRSEARLKIATWIVDFYNVRRRHSACDGMSPVDYERFIAEARGPPDVGRSPKISIGFWLVEGQEPKIGTRRAFDQGISSAGGVRSRGRRGRMPR
ncbi:integrase core domain-containing protein [Micromonospora sp. NBC_00898]|uniref:integrase core domain-containing protein n=1 Tax=Micromonospora sp. NBC_00898 TaxID=2975981 RepID=UPI0038707C95